MHTTEPMHQTTQPIFYTPKPKWQWSKVSSSLVTDMSGKVETINLKPTVAFEDPDSEPNMGRLRVSLSIDVQKSLPYDSSIGWNWHKSSNLPPITIKMEMQGANLGQSYPLPDNLQARIFAVKIIPNNLDSQATLMEDVGLKGVSKVQMKQQYAIFDGIRFHTTSYIKQGVKFNLLILLYIKDKCQQKNGKQENSQISEIKNVITAVISPPIFVDSRKSARDYFEKRYMSYADAFNPILMQRQFLKKSNKDKDKQRQKQKQRQTQKQKQKQAMHPESEQALKKSHHLLQNSNSMQQQDQNQNQNEIKIQNSLQGLFNYLTAPNIRHKVKHPLLLCVKFSNVFKIMYNLAYEDEEPDKAKFKERESMDQHLSYGVQIQSIIQKLQKILLTQIGRDRKQKKPQTCHQAVQHDKPFIVYLIGQCSSPKKTKIYQCLQYLNCNSIEFVKHCNQLGSEFGSTGKENYRNLLEIGDIVKAYKRCYGKLREMSNLEIGNRESQGRDGFRDREKEREKNRNKEFQASRDTDKDKQIQKQKQKEISLSPYKNPQLKLPEPQPQPKPAPQTLNLQEQYLTNCQYLQNINSSLNNKNSYTDRLIGMMRKNEGAAGYGLGASQEMLNGSAVSGLLNLGLGAGGVVGRGLGIGGLDQLGLGSADDHNSGYYKGIIQQISFQNSILQNMLLQNYLMRQKLAYNILNNMSRPTVTDTTRSSGSIQVHKNVIIQTLEDKKQHDQHQDESDQYGHQDEQQYRGQNQEQSQLHGQQQCKQKQKINRDSQNGSLGK